MQAMHLRAITQGNVPIAITPMLGQVQYSTTADLLIASAAMQAMHLLTITLGSVPIAITPMHGQEQYSTIPD